MTAQAIVPSGSAAGGGFVAMTPDGQQLTLTVPTGVSAGQSFSYQYTPMQQRADEL